MTPAHPEQIIVVDERNRAIGHAEKHEVHQRGLLHRAFSVFLYDERHRILLQQRHPSKYHSGGLWANSCCGHPRVREQTESAARRRVKEELGVLVDLTFGFYTRYQTSFANGLHENEIVYVYFGLLQGSADPCPSEVADLRFAELNDVKSDLRDQPQIYTYWFRHYIEGHFDEIARFLGGSSAPRGMQIAPST
jgi:isopentenyl-diphosphate delta-isomerase